MNISTENLEMTRAEAADAREELLQQTQEWIGRTTVMMSTVLSEFPNTQMTHYDLGWDSHRIKSRVFTTPRIVLPAKEVNSIMKSGSSIVRRSATTMSVYYDYPASERKNLFPKFDIAKMPAPDEITIAYPHPLANAADIKDPRIDLYKYNDTTTISRDTVRMLPWVADMLCASLPYRVTQSRDGDELLNFDVFKEYPDEALARRPDAINFHRQKLAHFVDSLAVVTAALQDETLNPRQ